MGRRRRARFTGQMDMGTWHYRAIGRLGAVIALGAMAMACPKAFGGGYLTAIGPGSFRFQQPKNKQDLASLPPLRENVNDTDSNSTNSSTNHVFYCPVVINTAQT